MYWRHFESWNRGSMHKLALTLQSANSRGSVHGSLTDGESHGKFYVGSLETCPANSCQCTVSREFGAQLDCCAQPPEPNHSMSSSPQSFIILTPRDGRGRRRQQSVQPVYSQSRHRDAPGQVCRRQGGAWLVGSQAWGPPG